MAVYKTRNAKPIFTEDERREIIKVKTRVAHYDNLNVFNGFKPKRSGDYVPPYVIAGGVFPSLFMNEEIRDLDVFLLESGKCVVANFIDLNAFKASEVNYVDSPDIYSSWKSKELVANLVHVNYIFTKFRTRDDLLANFDFAHCCVSYHDGILHISRAIYDSIKMKKLVPVNPEKVTDWRTQKFVDRGYTR